MRQYRLTEEQMIKLLFETIEAYHKYLVVYGRDDKSARYAAASQVFSSLNKKDKRKRSIASAVVKV